MEGAKLALICPSPALRPKGWDCELLCSGCIPAIRLSGRETRLGSVDVKQGVGMWATVSKTEMWESSSLPRLLMNKTFFSFFSMGNQEQKSHANLDWKYPDLIKHLSAIIKKISG